MSSGPRILERARGKARASIITAAINYSVPEPQGPPGSSERSRCRHSLSVAEAWRGEEHAQGHTGSKCLRSGLLAILWDLKEGSPDTPHLLLPDRRGLSADVGGNKLLRSGVQCSRSPIWCCSVL